ncbi:hypothetical protein HPB47_010873 [Ixodes persulcatus]|uniref:Uncharacterized protein n=1 Tax=Ixodes persulcatus TaxID=34615 RepID=A0AC60NXX2_IXOPE|nr:hypothetical protein HPB47_010873 [Ixodes persulcatus]
MRSRMGDESMQSGMSGLESAPTAEPALGQARADNILKKLSAYWIIIGAIPLVLFCAVAIPTVFYVKSISSMSAQKAHAGGKPCMDYFDYVCKASDIKLLDDRKKEMPLLSSGKRQFDNAEAGDIITNLHPKLPGSLVKIDHATSIPIEGIRRYGVDALLHVELVHNSAANSSYNFDLPIPAHSCELSEKQRARDESQVYEVWVGTARPSLASFLVIGSPEQRVTFTSTDDVPLSSAILQVGIPDMGDLEYTELLDSANIKLDAWVKSTYPALNDEPFTGETIVKFYASFVKMEKPWRFGGVIGVIAHFSHEEWAERPCFSEGSGLQEVAQSW